MSAFNIQSEENTLDLPLVIDIEGAGAKSVEHGAALLTNNPSGMPSQFWTKVPTTSSPGWFTIRSNLVDKDSGAALAEINAEPALSGFADILIQAKAGEVLPQLLD